MCRGAKESRFDYGAYQERLKAALVQNCRVLDNRGDGIRGSGMVLVQTTILRWVQRYVPEFEKRWSRYAQPVGGSGRCEETYIGDVKRRI